MNKFTTPGWRLLLAVALPLSAGAALAAGPTGLLNDTGDVTCRDAAFQNTACDAQARASNSFGIKLGQDGQTGRDVASPTKVGGGAAGFDFTRICWNGAAQGSASCTGTLVANYSDTAQSPATSTDWACTKDNVTNLIWSLKFATGIWSNAASVAVLGHNGANRCGLNAGWRLPTRRELFSIVHNGLSTMPAIDVAYFPGVNSNSYFWTSNLWDRDRTKAHTVNFDTGQDGSGYVSGGGTQTLFFRFVHDGP